MNFREQSIVYVDFEGLKYFHTEYLRKSVFDLKAINVNLPEIVNFVDNLIFTYSTIGVNYDDILNVNDAISKLLVKRIISINYPLNIHQNIQKFVDSCSIDDFDILPNYILTNLDSISCLGLEKKYGIKFIPKDLENWNIENCRVEIKQIKSKCRNSVIESIRKLSNVHEIYSMLLVDKYIYENIFVKDNDILLDFVEKWKLHDEREMLVCGKSSDFENLIINYKQQNDCYFYNQFIQFPLKLEMYKIHDRFLFTNNFFLSVGYGFQKQYPNSTDWIIHPIGLGRVYFDKIKEMSVTLFKEMPFKIFSKYLKEIG